MTARTENFPRHARPRGRAAAHRTHHGQVQTAQAADPGHVCSLLSGDGDCFSCDTPLPEAERNRITIRHHGDITTIARVTCPTAPKFWRWRDIPLPRVVPRDVEFIEHAGEVDEWKSQLAAAILCGVFGLAGGICSARAVQNHCVTSRPVSRAVFIRRRRSGNGCKSGRLTCIF